MHPYAIRRLLLDMRFRGSDNARQVKELQKKERNGARRAKRKKREGSRKERERRSSCYAIRDHFDTTSTEIKNDTKK